MYKKDKIKCTKECTGKIEKMVLKDGKMYITAAYRVDGISYRIKEKVRMKSRETGRRRLLGKKSTALPSIVIGTPVRIAYNTADPWFAYIMGNE